MNYCNTADLIDRYGRDEMLSLSDRERTGQMDYNVLERAIGDASAEMDAHLAGRYTLPFERPPKVLRVYCTAIARYRLYDESAPEQVRRNYDDAIKFLRAIADGSITLGAADDGSVARTGAGADVRSDGRVFGRDSNAFL